MNILVLDVVLGLAGVYILSRVFWRVRIRGGPLPPGPKALPLVGNILDLPKGREGPHWAKHKDLYGPISSLTVLGQTVVIINEASLAFELLEKKSTIYSDRPTFVFGGELCGIDSNLTLLQYGPRFRATRKLLHQYMGPRTVASLFEALEILEARRFLLRTARSPEKFMAHIRTMAGTVILRLAYGYTVAPDGPDPLIELADIAMERFSHSSQPGTWMVDIMPFLKYFPEWLPGMGFKKTAREWKADNLAFANKPFEFTKKQMEKGINPPSFASAGLARGILNDDESDMLKWAAAVMYAGGSDTTVSAIATFFLAMTLNPSALAYAQAEIDSVIGAGPERLPTFEDRARLPYVDALVKECLRWEVVAPQGIPHVTSENDTVRGYFIPKGAVIVPNIWQLAHDPEIYHDPWTFKPERFLGVSPEPDPRTLAFGFGRRICPGKELADASLFITIAMCIAMLNITKVKDTNGQDIEPQCEYSAGTVSHPKEFECSIKPRSEKAERLIASVEDEHPFEIGDAYELDGIKCTWS